MSPQVIFLTVFAVTILLLHLVMKLSEANARLLVIEKKVLTLLHNMGGPDPDVPAETEDTIIRLETLLANVPQTENVATTAPTATEPAPAPPEPAAPADIDALPGPPQPS